MNYRIVRYLSEDIRISRNRGWVSCISLLLLPTLLEGRRGIRHYAPVSRDPHQHMYTSQEDEINSFPYWLCVHV